jgi:hypothetical protein
MAAIGARVLEMMKAGYVKKHGPLHPAIEKLPEEAQVELLKQAESDGVILDARSIDAALADLDVRFAALQKIVHHFV